MCRPACLADAFLAGGWTRTELVARGAAVLGVRARWLPALSAAVSDAYRDPPVDRPRELQAFIATTLAELQASGRLTARPPSAPAIGFAAPAAMGRRRWPVPEISTLAELAGFLALRHDELDWLADARGYERTVKDEPLRNYHYRWIERRSGRPRLVEAPKPLLKDAQRRVLRAILDPVPPHHAAHGFRRGHSAFTNARRHVRQQVVIGFDLEDFFATVSAARVYGIFRTAGYPEAVAHRLTALCTNVIPEPVWDAAPRPSSAADLSAHFRLGRALATPHLPQGAPTSPAIANLAALALDRRLGALAVAGGGVYSRYADDIVLSGDRWLLENAAAIRSLVARIAHECGFRLNARKSRLVTRAGSQRVTGVVVNSRPNVPRRDYDRLKATLHSALRDGPAAANRSGHADFRAHLQGRIAWVHALNPDRATKLRELWARIDWEG